jgi:2-oxo-hept-3-ene-1,7-dioate hydratase
MTDGRRLRHLARLGASMKLAAGPRGRAQDWPDFACHAAASQINEPDYGTLLDDMLFAPGDIPMTASLPTCRGGAGLCAQARWKATTVTVDDVLDATDFVTPAIEIIDSRIEQFDRHTKVMRRVRHHQRQRRQRRHRLGGRRVAPRDVDLPLVRRILRQNGAVEETGWPLVCRATLPSAWPGWPTSWRPGANAWRPARWCWQARSPGRSPGKRGDRFDADYGPLGRFEFLRLDPPFV